MNMAVDIGNTVVKAAVFDDGHLVETFKNDIADAPFIDSVLDAYPSVDNAIVLSTRGDAAGVAAILEKKVARTLLFDHTVPVPVKNLYKTPESLGPDRLAAAVGANAIYPGANVLIVDFGTAITIDVINARGEYLGGNISPGAGIRFRALHEFTGKLPLGTLTGGEAIIPSDSRQAIESGVANGIVFEIEGYIARLQARYADLKIIFTGGDGNFFAKRLKNTIFATYDLVVYGLNRILEYNAC